MNQGKFFFWLNAAFLALNLYSLFGGGGGILNLFCIAINGFGTYQLRHYAFS